MKVLVTGASGVLGQRLLKDLQGRHHQIVVVSRNPDKHLFPEQVKVLKGDLKHSADVHNCLRQAGQPDCIIHLAACVRWNLTVHDAVRCNTDPVELMLSELKKTAKNPRMIFVSTAFVDECSHPKKKRDKRGLWSQDQFNNSYEYSKYLAEESVKGSGFSYHIIRPGIITGAATDGSISSFNGMYQLLKIFVSGHLPFVVGHAHAILDISPVDQVSEGIIRVLEGRVVENGAYYVCGGRPVVTLKQLVDKTFAIVNQVRQEAGQKPVRKLPVITPATYERFYKPMADKAMSGKQKQYMNLLGYFLPYMSLQRVRNIHPGQNLMDRKSASRSLDASIRYWCDKNQHLIIRDPYNWKSLA